MLQHGVAHRLATCLDSFHMTGSRLLFQGRNPVRSLLRNVSDAALVNWNGIEVGRLQASTGLRAALQALRV